ncbi:MAG: aminotransferase class IV [Saprospiraceae bacterium]
MYCFLNGEILPEQAASLHLNDLALLRGYGIFDYFLFERFQPRFLEDYLDRFFRSAALLRLQCPVDREGMRQGIHRVIAANEVQEGGIRLVLTGGYSHDSYTPTEGNVFILQAPIPRVKEELFQRGARAALYQHQRELPMVKSLNYLTGIHILPWLAAQDAEFVVYHDGTFLRESDRSNFFIVDANGHLLTPADKVLAGVTRKHIIAAAHELGIPVEEREVAVAELDTAAEAFITSSIKGALAVSSMDGKPIGNGKPGPITQRLQQAFLEKVAIH